MAEVVRSGLTESRHRGAVVAIGADGRDVLRAGDVDAAMFPRSANKPMQAAAMLGCGLRLGGRLLALAAASHAGESFHVAGVREILAGAGLAEDALQCPPALPLDEGAQHRLLREGGTPRPVYMNCSGKHAAMLATCVAAGWPTGGYLDPDHPLQRKIRRTVERLCEESVAAVGVDGCGAPLFAVSLTGLARAFRALVLAPPGTAERRVADAMRAHPGWTSGSQRPQRAVMAAVPGLVVKSGAEGVEALALADGGAAAFKIDDGSARAAPAVTVALLRLLGATTREAGRGGVSLPGTDALVTAAGGDAGGPVDRGPDRRRVDLGTVGNAHGGGDWPAPAGAGRLADPAGLDGLASPPVYGGGRVVGRIRATLPA